ncbi:hypothetical protein RND81_04G046400 [Saponaria officinalis]|uniref:ERAD-associated E3 ubiquitin-protein ligase component HRD3A n=1 Tax=Saponaria officinalis TaxID=3572 RepID=A0AAW1LII6_SAPOF
MPPLKYRLLLLLTLSLLAFTSVAKLRPYVLVLTQDDLRDSPSLPTIATESPDSSDPESSDSDWDEFGDPESKSDDDLDPGSWRPVLDPDPEPAPAPEQSSLYYSGLSKLISASSSGDVVLLEEAAREIEVAAKKGEAHARSVLGFLYQMGIGRERDQAKAFLFHHFAADAGNLHSKMALAHTYARQDMYEKAAKLYCELAEVAVKNFLISKDAPVMEPVRIHVGAEENKEALRKSRGEDDEDFQILEYQAQKGNAAAMYKMGLFYYFGLRGLRRDPAKALSWFLKAVEKGEPRSMEYLGEIYVRGVGVERNYTKAMEWLTLAAKQQLGSAYNGVGYMYVKGYGVERKNFTKARELFEKAAHNEDAGGYYNLGVLYLKGVGVKKDVKLACKYFLMAANNGQPKAFYQLAKMFHTGVGLKKNLETATALYKLVAERGPWNSLSRWALEAYLKGDVGKALLLYSRMAELGYEVAQSNAAWILDKAGEPSLCLGASGLCTDTERHQRAHSLWWQASEQGNEHAALLIGDAYYYGRGTEKDYERAAEAYKHARSQANAQALFNLGYMHEHGQGLPYDLHLAKRYYDEALETDSASKLPVTLALTSLWIRKNYADSFLVHTIDALPEMYPKIEAWVENTIMEEGNATILTLFVCLLTVLYLREWQRRHAVPPAQEAAAPVQPFNEQLIQAPH